MIPHTRLLLKANSRTSEDISINRGDTVFHYHSAKYIFLRVLTHIGYYTYIEERRVQPTQNSPHKQALYKQMASSALRPPTVKPPGLPPATTTTQSSTAGQQQQQQSSQKTSSSTAANTSTAATSVSSASPSSVFGGYSYAKALVFAWAVVLVALCVKQLFFVLAVVAAGLTYALLTTADGDAKMLFPLFVLSERLLVETTSLRHSPVMLFGCVLFAYSANVSGSPLSAVLGAKDSKKNAASASAVEEGGAQIHPSSSAAVTSSAPSTQQRLSRVPFVYGAVGVGAIFLLTSQLSLALPMAAYVFTGLVCHRQLQRAVTAREAIIVSHLAGFFACDAIINVNLNPAAFREMTITSFTHMGGRSALLMGLGVTAAMALLGGGRIVSRSRWWGTSSSASATPITNGKESAKKGQRQFGNTKERAGAAGFAAGLARTAVFVASAGSLTIGAYFYCGRRFGEDPFAWLFQYVGSSPMRSLALLLWVTGIPLAVAGIAYVNSRNVLPKILYRKLYHLLALVAFLPVGIFDPEFLAFSVMLATTLGVLAECARACRLPLPFMAAFDAFMLRSIDGREGGAAASSAASLSLSRKQAALAASARRRFAEEAVETESADPPAPLLGPADSTGDEAPFSPTSVVEGAKFFAPEEAARTRGPKGLIRTHLFLLFGLAMPIILHSRQQQMPARPLSPIVLCSLFLLPGLVGLGVMDSAAAAFGTLWWRLVPIPRRNSNRRNDGGAVAAPPAPLKLHRIFCGARRGFTVEANSALAHKTVEGTIGGLVAAFAAWGAILAFLVAMTGVAVPVRAVIPSVVAIVLGSAFEACVDGIDNLELPLFMAGVIQTTVLVLGKFF